MTAPRDSDQLRAVQKATRYALAELDRVCEELGLRYVVYGGTAIGAVRHGGFIPWDDDVDVCMPRSDYERLLSEGPTILHDGFVLIASETDPAYPKSFGILGLAGSEFTPTCSRSIRFPRTTRSTSSRREGHGCGGGCSSSMGLRRRMYHCPFRLMSPPQPLCTACIQRCTCCA